MKVKSLIALFIILFKFCNIIKAQSTPGLDVPIVSLHSPNVVELGKYGDYPVNPSTGVLPVDIPLYTIKSAKLEFPISLSYHASGIKVEQEASYVGLGWSLNASGVITRQVRDKEDERSTGGFLYTGKSLPDYNDISQPHLPGILGQKGYADSIDTWYEVWDKEPDIFNAFAGGLNAEFCLDNNGNFLSTIFDSLKYNINFHDTILIITDKTGTIYRFGKSVDNISACESIECTSSTKEANTGTISGPFVPQPKYPSSWFLTEIISADKSDTISFRYKPGESSTLKIVSQNQNIGIENSDANLNNLYTNILFSASTTLQIIDKIKFRNGWIQFTTATDRQDMDQTLDANALNNARITGFTVFDNQNNAIQKVVFDNNDYFDRTGNGNLIDSYFDYSYNRKSLKLNGVKFYDKNDVFVNDYKFQYDNTPLPPRNNTAQDYWGYYNGKANESLMPGTWYAQYYSGQPLHLGGDRNADFNFMKAASLIQMTYPTGGYSKFDYEPNYYLNAQQTQHKSEQTNTVFLQALQTSGRTPNCTLPVGLRNLNANDSIQFTVSEELEVVPATLLITFSDFKIVNSSSMTVTLTDLTGGAVFSFEQNTLTMTQNKVISQNITLIQDHTYKIEAKTNAVTGSDFGWCDCPFIQITLSYKYWLADAPNNIIVPEQAGGLRIKSITNYNTDNTVVSKKRYIYGDTTYGPGNVGVGNLITDSARNYYYFPILTTPSDPTLKACIYYRLFNFIWYQSNGIVEMGLNNGCSVFYSKVTELALSTNDTSISNGKTEYYYDAPLNYNNPLPSYKYRYSNWIYPTWGHNNLTKKIDYKLQNSVYERIHEMDYVYELRPEQRIKTLKVVELEPL